MPLRNMLGVLGLLALTVLAACAPGEPAADFALTTFDGEEFRLSEQRGKVVVVNFWYPSCPPCRDEMPAFQEVWEQYRGRNVRFIGLFVPQGFDTEESAREFVDELGLTFTFATDVRALVAQEYAVVEKDVLVQAALIKLLLEQEAEALIEANNTTTTVQVLDKATLPQKKARPRRFLIVFVAGILSLFATVSFVIGGEYVKGLKKRWENEYGKKDRNPY